MSLNAPRFGANPHAAANAVAALVNSGTGYFTPEQLAALISEHDPTQPKEAQSMPVSAEARNESPEQYTARICAETEGGRLILVDKDGHTLIRSDELRWVGHVEHSVYTDPERPIVLRVLRDGEPLWCRLLAPDGRDVGWRGMLGKQFSDMLVLPEGSQYSFTSLVIYPPL